MPAKKIGTDIKPKKETATKKSVTSGMSVSMISISGTTSGQLDLPRSIFGVEVNKPLLAQALRVYLNNLKSHSAHTKTRAEVSLTTKKFYRQKGTGGARHGAKSAPIYVGGGVALGPKSRKVRLDLPKKMKVQALLSALSQKAVEKSVFGVAGLENVSGKTKELALLGDKFDRKSVLVVTDEKISKAINALRNLSKINILTIDQLNAYEVIRHQSLALTKGAVAGLEQKLVEGKKKGEAVA